MPNTASSSEPFRLAVLGSPIAHSRSPQLHAAAYAALGLDWRYEAVECEAEDLAAFIAGCGPEWRGLSLTMPLKRTVVTLLDESDRLAGLTTAANTILFEPAAPSGRRLRGFNTDVAGIVGAI